MQEGADSQSSGLRRAREALASGRGGARPLRWVVACVLVLLLLVVFPPFHVRRIDSSARDLANDHAASADVAHRAAQFWNSRLISQQAPTDFRALIEALGKDPVQASQRYGRRPGIGGAWFYLVSGEAHVVTIDSRGLWLDVPGLGDWRVLLQTGPIFGSALRDDTGLLRLEDFSSFDFNEMGAQLNRLSETQVGSILRRDARVGSQVDFVAAGRLDNVSGDGHTLLLAPIRVSLK